MRDEREQYILKELRLRGSVSAARLADQLHVSSVTVRRDLEHMERKGMLGRVHGGAVALDDRPERGSRRGGAPILIGMVAPTTGNYYGDIIRSAQERASRHRARLVLGVTNYREEDERRFIEGIIRTGVDGLLVTPSKVDFTGPTFDLLNAAPVPVILVERSIDHYRGGPQLDSVRTDHELGAQMCVHHLFERGHRRIAIVTTGNPTTQRLLAGYARACDDLGIEPIQPSHARSDEDWRGHDAYEQVHALLDELARSGATAVIVQPDAHAIVLVQEYLRRGLRVPEDLAIVTYDDRFSELAEIPLTGVRPPAAELGATAVDMCIERIQSRGGGRTVKQLRLSPALIPRRSSERVDRF
jgi:DNA-binding LacI/PurR family transcriptional regulator